MNKWFKQYSQAQGYISPESEASMDPTEILSLLEKPTRDGRPFLYQIRDEATVMDIVAALRASPKPHTRSMLCYILNLRAGAEFFEGQSSETKQAVPALIEALADSNTEVRREAIDALGHIGDPAAGPDLLRVYYQEHDVDLRVLLASVLGFCQYAPAIPALIEALASPKSLLRRQATWGLRHLRAQESKGPMQKALAQETDPLTQQTMQATLEELEHPSPDEATIDRLIAQLRNAETTQEREAAAIALGERDKRVLLALLALLDDKQGEVRHSAAVAISASGVHSCEKHPSLPIGGTG